MKIVFRFALLCVAVAFVVAEDAKELERPKTFRRLIPADVLRGELNSNQSFPNFRGKLAIYKNIKLSSSCFLLNLVRIFIF